MFINIKCYLEWVLFPGPETNITDAITNQEQCGWPGKVSNARAPQTPFGNFVGDFHTAVIVGDT